MSEVKGKVALVTGATSGIGAAIAVRLAQEGAQLCLVGRNEQRLAEINGLANDYTGDVIAFSADLRKENQIQKMRKAVDERFGTVDILIHAAGVAGVGLVEEAPYQALVNQFTVNVLAPFFLTQIFLPVLRARKGQVVFINSRAGMTAYAGMSQYCATKFALRALADSLRLEVAPDGVRVFSVYPGKVATPMLESVCHAQGKHYDPMDYLQPTDVADLVMTGLCQPHNVEITDLTVRPQGDAI